MLARLHQVVSAVCPIEGVSVGQYANRSTWSFDPLPGATSQQRTSAQAVIDAFDDSAEAQAAWEEDQKPERKSLRQAAQQAVADNQAYLALASPNAAQMRAQLDAVTRQNNAIIRRLIQID